MFYHVKELQFNARVSKPDPKFANILLEQFGGANGELKAAMDYFIQAFGLRKAYPDKYDLLMDIATEEFSHLEIVGATIQMLLTGVNSELKDVAESSEISKLLDGNAAKETIIHEAMVNPQFLAVTSGTPPLTNSQGVPWTAAYVNANGDLSVDLRSNIASESRAKIVYENLLQFTDDEYVKDTLKFLMAREVAHLQMFEAALATVQPNYPPGISQGDPRYTNKYFNMSRDGSRGPWNQGKNGLGETWQVIDNPIDHVLKTDGLLSEKLVGTDRTVKSSEKAAEQLGKIKSKEVSVSMPDENIRWSNFEAARKKDLSNSALQ